MLAVEYLVAIYTICSRYFCGTQCGPMRSSERIKRMKKKGATGSSSSHPGADIEGMWSWFTSLSVEERIKVVYIPEFVDVGRV